jgi:hypothetical protein
VNPDWRTRGQEHDRGIEEQPPYWRDWANVARYPFAGTNGITIGVFAIISALGLVPVIGAFAALFLLLAVPKHALEVLRDSAHGHRQPPQFGFDIGDRAVFAFLAILLAFAVVHLALQMFLPGWAPPAWRLLMALALPLVAMSLAIDEQIGRALNPLFWMQVMLRIGPAYVGAVALIWFGLGFGVTGAAWLDRVLPPFFGAMVSTTVALWAIFAAAHIGGRLLFQYRDALGFTPTGPEQPGKLRFSRDHRLEDQVDELLARGETKAARRAIEDDLRERALSAPLHKRYREILRAERDSPALLAHGRQWLHQRIVEGDARAGLSLLQECLDLDPRFAPLDPADWPPLLAAAERAGMARLAEAARAAQSPPTP